MSDFLPSRADIQAVYDHGRLTAPYVLIRAMLLKSGRVATEEVWWSIKADCESLAIDEPVSGFVPSEEIQETKYAVLARQVWMEILDAAEEAERRDNPRPC